MAKKWMWGLMILCGTLLLAIPGLCEQDVPDLTPEIRSGKYVQKVDNFMVIIDASGSKGDDYKGKQKLAIAKDVVELLNRTLPDINLMAALRTFGIGRTLFSKDKTRIVYAPSPYAKEDFRNALQGISEAGGLSFMAPALRAAGADLRVLPGKTAIIILSDGKIHTEDPIAATKELKNEFHERVCIYTVFIPSNTADNDQVALDMKLMRGVAAASECGISFSLAEVSTGEGMADFVKKVFLSMPDDTDGDGVKNTADQCPDTPVGVKVDERGCPLDGDRDGVPDYMDKCPGTPLGVQVNDTGCPKDRDQDGVPDDLDKCPDTPKGASVDKNGCKIVRPTGTSGDADKDGVTDDRDQCPDTPEGARVNPAGCWIVGGVPFESGKAALNPQVYPELDEIVRVLENNPELIVEIQGHTDNFGTAKYNMDLSQKRARVVSAYLLKKGVAADRLTYKGYGFTRPLANNATPEGRALNRRVEIKPVQ